MQNPVCWFEIYVQDMKRAKTFYESVFNTKLEKLPNNEMEMFAFNMNSEGFGASGALIKMEGVPSSCGGTVVYFTTQDCNLELKRIEENGGKISKPKFSIGQYGFIALAFDTEGNMFGLHSMK